VFFYDVEADGYPFIRAGSLEGLLSGQTEDDCEKIDAETARRYRMRLYPKDTILFAKSGMSAKIGRV
jgi:type I restriction enzyme S subunit